MNALTGISAKNHCNQQLAAICISQAIAADCHPSGDMQMSTTSKLAAQEQQALADALDDEYKSHETYTQVIRDFGEVRPFINIVEAEARHITALLGLFEHYNVTAPANKWLGQTPRYTNLHEACVAGVQGEIENVALYDRLFLSTQRTDILNVFQSLRSASQDRHLPAFQRCAQR
jgi:hypothetical protein